MPIYRQPIALLQRIATRAQAGKSIATMLPWRVTRQILDGWTRLLLSGRDSGAETLLDGVKLPPRGANNAKPPAIAKGFAQVHRAAVGPLPRT